MIAVIADDFTGAAELAGISLRYGLQVKLYTGIASYEACDVCIVSSDSRSMSRADALEVTRNIVVALQELNPSFIYKKIDSVLRGYVFDEISVQMQLTGKQRAIILPANPSLGRKIISGQYYINEQLITDTAFADDPEFPVKSALVKEMISKDGKGVDVLSRGQDKWKQIISIAEASTIEDMDHWVGLIESAWLLAGAGDFFERLLAASFAERFSDDPAILLPHLYVCGTTAQTSQRLVEQIDQGSGNVIYLHHTDLARDPFSFTDAQFAKIQDIVYSGGKLLLAVGHTADLTPQYIRESMAGVVQHLQQQLHFREIFIEGGSTAAAILKRLQLSSFDIANESQRGVVRMKAGDLYITVKPGSYAVPQSIKDLYLTKPYNQQS
ncbi:four-carbon acid sugar kinase family protein [Terrimonas sp. NA20]|uniref:Four-carbon acid sugar kinase family protein n=1 Tax=Terrimonas ginsenosidimutans TaxID=2908004 RepID=A0ABS9KR94_9BACT|nr:four-carbon acid sugar kinase family protein [Terrimonas ginsenosidimutans]MCG2614836.1 four-carbon acid sugar kinase family protein [Terrimonas ginsenosidimutans]